MRFLLRAFRGLGLAVLTLALVGWGALSLVRAIDDRQAERSPRGAPPERVIPAEMAVLKPETVRPRLAAHGRVASARTLELHAAAGGRLVHLSPAFRDGGRVIEGERLWRVDPAAAKSALARARIARDEADAEARIAADALELARKDFEGAGRQRDLRARALQRQEDMRDRGIGSETAVETAAIALVEAEGRHIAREQALIAAENRAALAEIALRLARLAVEDAERALAETEMHAPFAGLVAEADVALGRRVAAGERLGVLFDPEAYEAAVEAPGRAVSRLLDSEGRVPALEASVRLALDPEGPAYPAELLRIGAASGPSGAGRTLHLGLAPEAARTLRPGDFVTAEIVEPPIEGVARLPARALDAEDAILVLGEDDRLKRVTLDVVRRLGDEVLAAGAPFGALYLERRRPQFGPGVKVEPLVPDPPEDPDRDAAAEVGERVALSAEERARLTALVAAEAALSPERRARLLADLEAPEVSRATLERIERLGDAAARPSGG
jgi:multidrug efflux pump subunit AcrA (membrane-fusion protein)